MHTEILVPVDSTPGGIQISDYSDTFSHLKTKRFSGFFLRDFFSKSEKSKIDPVIEVERIELEGELEAEAQHINLPFKLLDYQSNLQSLVYQSRFADVMVVGSFSPEMAAYFDRLFPEKLLSSIHCPLYLISKSTNDFQEIVFVFDCSVSSLAALKSFISMFGDKYYNTRITIVTVCPEQEAGVYFEKHLIDYVQNLFEDVGILPMSNKNLIENLINYGSKSTKPLLIMGQSALELIESKTFLKRIAGEGMSLFYSNN
ncbi:MAG: hypothetical protein HC811_02955 [Flammeovirgaceae bacterium]|nr:hypothetical protein [Flammeovirgaceae bacterium]